MIWDCFLIWIVDDLKILKKTKLYTFKFQKSFFNMKELNYEENSKVLNRKDEVMIFKCELQENIQKAMKEFVEEHPNWDQYRILQAAIAGFWCKRISK